MLTYIGQMICVAFGYPPAGGWLYCDGSRIPIDLHPHLFAVLGVKYGGDGATYFCLPDLRGRTAIGAGQLPNGLNYNLGDKGGAETVALSTLQYPTHNHSFAASTDAGNSNQPAGLLGSGQTIYTTNPPLTKDALDTATVSFAPGNGNAHENRQPYVTCSWLICYTGIFPGRD